MAGTHRGRGGFQRIVHTLWRFTDDGFFSPKAISYEPMFILLNCPDRKQRDELTCQWRDNKLAELNFVGIVAALLTGCLTSTGSWPTVLQSGVEAPWTVRCSWYCGIILGLASILSAADQTIRLHRISSHRDSLSNIRHLLSRSKRDEHGQRVPRRFQVYTWQLPVMFLLCSTLCMIVGMFILIWSATGRGDVWWNDNSKVATIFTTITIMTALAFFGAQISLYSPIAELDEDNAED